MNRENRESKKYEELGAPGSNKHQLKGSEQQSSKDDIEKNEVSNKEGLQPGLKEVKNEELRKNEDFKKRMKDRSGRSDQLRK